MAKTNTSEHQQQDLAQSIDSIMGQTDRLIDTARPDAVFAEPVTIEGRTVIGAAEVLIGAGFGGGGGFGPGSSAEQETDAAVGAASGGMGAGVGGFAQSRPVAVIIIDRDGVRVEPVVDVTKLGLAALTVFGSMLFFLGGLIRKAKRVAR